MQRMQLPLDWERKPEKIQACLDSNPDVNLFDSTCWKVSSIRLIRLKFMQEPITRSEQLPCTRVTAFSRTSLFLERFWRPSLNIF